MKKNHTRAEIAHWIERILDETNIYSREAYIDQIIPDEVLKQCDDYDVLWAADQYGFIIKKCPRDHVNYKANGVWRKPEGTLAMRLYFHVPLVKELCPDCEREHSETY